MNRQEIGQWIESAGIVPVIRAPSPELALRAASAAQAGGANVVEITMTVPDALSVLRQLVAQVGTEMLVGAGTVLDAATTSACIEAGAEFIVSPGLDLESIRVAHQANKAICPGALTPTEVITAWRAGADMVKVFPCSAVGGAGYIRALKAPLPDVKLVPTGGVNLATAPGFIAAGATALGVGTALVDLKLLAEQGEPAVAERVRQFVAVVREARTARDQRPPAGPDRASNK